MKQTYKIAASLDKGYLDVEVALQNKGGVGLRPLPLSVLVIWIVAIFGGFILIINESLPIHNLPLPFKLLFAAALLGFTYFASSRDQGNQPRFLAIRNMFSYMFVKGSRILKTRNTDPATAFYRLVKVKDINEKTGLVTFMDGTVAYFYRVVGNASSLLFDSDKAAIIDRVDNFYRKLPDFIRCTLITVKEPQKVATQKVYLKKLYQNLRVRDRDLLKIMEDSFENLDRYVGGEFKSIHQYMVLYAGSKEYADKAHTILTNEVHNSGLMISDLEPLYYEDVTALFHTVYAGDY